MIDGYFEHEYDELDEQIDREIEEMYKGLYREWPVANHSEWTMEYVDARDGVRD